jgi:hypothetical protein
VSEFLRILVEIENRSESLSGGPPVPNIFGAAPFSGPSPESSPADSIISAYLQTTQDRMVDPPVVASTTCALDAPEQYDATSFARDLRDARRCPNRLKALRRKIAWRLHPDRRLPEASDNSVDLAKFNAEIDAAIASFNG